jgi:hypothetical protein
MLARHITDREDKSSRMKFASLINLLQERYGADTREVAPHHWMFEVETGTNRTQVVHILMKEISADGQDVSRIVVTSPIGRVPARFSLEMLLRKNAKLDVGAVCIEDIRDEENHVVPYLTLRASHLVATADFEEIWEMVEKVAVVADSLEKEIYASDRH